MKAEKEKLSRFIPPSSHMAGVLPLSKPNSNWVSLLFSWAVASCRMCQEIRNIKINLLCLILAYFNGVANLDAT
jgi:hypothetical protein